MTESEADTERLYNRLAQQDKRANRLARGLCVYCAQKPPREGKQTCADCGKRWADNAKKYRPMPGALTIWRTVDLEALAVGSLPSNIVKRAQVAAARRRAYLVKRGTVDGDR
jgi:hypothetical protein